MEITPAIHCKNEEYWIHYVLRDLLKVFDKVVMLDTGSTDNTVKIAKETAEAVGGKLTLMQEYYANSKHLIGNCPNILRETVATEWMLLVDGDEIWGESQLRNLVATEPPPGCIVGMCNGRNLMFKDGRLLEREGFSADRLFARDVRWNIRTDYPFQSHGLEDKFASGKVFHTNFEKSYFWHVRHLQRSSKDNEAFYRVVKQDYFPTPTRITNLPDGWIGIVNYSYPNPYIG